MRQWMALITATALAATGCGGEENGKSSGNDSSSTSNLTAAEAKDAVATTSSTTIGTAADASNASTTSGSTTTATFNPLFESSSEYATESYYLAWTANFGIGWVLSVVNGVTSYQPTSCSGDTCTWGPLELYARKDVVGTSWKLVVTKADSTSYTYALSGKNAVKGTDWLDVLSGSSQEPSHGKRKGTFQVNLERARELAPGEASLYGVLDVTYSNVDQQTVDATFVGAHELKSGKVFDAAYHFVNEDTGGDLAIAFQGSDGASARVSLHSRWDSTGAGRGDAQGSAAASTTSASASVTYQASECWDSKYRLTYDTDPEYGTSTDCASAFQSADYSTLTVR